MSIRFIGYNKDGQEVHVIDYYINGRSGKRIRQRVVGDREYAQAVEFALRCKAAPTPAANSRIKALLPKWLDYYDDDHSKSTMRDVISTVRNHLAPFFGDYYVGQLTPDLIDQFKKIRLEQGVSKRTVNKQLSYFASFLNYCVEEKLCQPLSFKIRKFKKTTPPKPKPFNIAEIDSILEAIEPQYRLIVLLMVDLGLRKKEATDLKVEDVFLDRDLVYVLGKGAKERIVPITTDRLRAALKMAVDKTGSGYLTVNPQTGRPYRSLKKALRRAGQAAGLDRHVHHHLLRHSFGTNSILAGVDVMKLKDLMGHSDVSTTQIYTHLAAEDLRESAGKLNQYTQKKSDYSSHSNSSKTQGARSSDG